MIVIDRASGPIQTIFQCPIRGIIRLKIKVGILDIPKLIMVTMSTLRFLIEVVLTYCKNRLTIIAGTIAPKNEAYIIYIGPILRDTELPDGDKLKPV